MLCMDNINFIYGECQDFKLESIRYNVARTHLRIILTSKNNVKSSVCPYCGSKKLEVHDNNVTILKDYPFNIEIKQEVEVKYFRYRCKRCNIVHSDKITFKEPNTRITKRTANFIRSFLQQKQSIKYISKLTGVHWDTIHKIAIKMMKEEILQRFKEHKARGYKPTYLAVDEFAIHKGHKYASCVMDIETGEIIWVGKGRSIEDFRKFFTEFDMSYLSNVKAIAMDMNASYNKLVTEYMPQVSIVYDSYHMKAQYGKEVLGAVRLQVAKKRKETAEKLSLKIDKEENKKKKQKLILKCKKIYNEYKTVKNARWALLTSYRNLKEKEKSVLNEILNKNSDLTICYTMKEEMDYLFSLRDPIEAKKGWEAWFKAAKESEIEPLVKFAKLKEKRLDGLVAHATHFISTGRLEGYNNKIKVAKRDGYGYRNEDFFFSLIKFLSLSISKNKFPTFP